ncbi:MAG TPA: hypothetical protein VGC22_00325 [Chitinophaga sp.]
MTIRYFFRLCLVMMIILSGSCRKDDPVNDNDKRWSVYLPAQVTTNLPVDLNFDGIRHTDLAQELPIDSISIYVQRLTANPVLDINWIEPEFDNNIFLKVLPDTLSSSTTLKYLPAAQQYYYHFADGQKSMVPDKGLAINNGYYTFIVPDTVHINGNTLAFTTKQDLFVSKQSHKQILIMATFNKAGEVNR